MTTFSALTLDEFLRQTSAKTPTPGGGAVASAVGALSAALAQMVVSYSVGKKSLAEHEPRLKEAAAILERARGLLMELAQEDAAAYGLVNELQKLPEGDPRRAELPAANLASVQVPLAVMAACVDLLRLFVSLAGITNRALRSDLGIAAVLAEATVRAGRWNVDVNLAFLGDEAEKKRAGETAGTLVAEAVRLCAETEKACGA
jgi:formiminotetrahydrofolate cyclodeaminase